MHDSGLGYVQDGAHPLTVLQKILDGARKWMGPFFGLEFILFLRKRSYFIFCRTRPPETVISSARTMTYVDTEMMIRLTAWQVPSRKSRQTLLHRHKVNSCLTGRTRAH